jgi:hypothetical protein
LEQDSRLSSDCIRDGDREKGRIEAGLLNSKISYPI